jgi:signal transduction histidine kinase
MRRRTTLKAEHLNRRVWLLWGVTFFVLLSLTIAIPLLYFPLLQSGEWREPDAGSLSQAYYAVIGLGGLMLLFCLYTVLKQRELNQIRTALANEGQETEDVRTRLSELSALFQMSTSLNLQLRLDVILEIIVRRVVSSLRAQQASIMVYNAETGELETRATYGLESEFARNAKKKLGEGIAGWVAQHQQAVMLTKNSKHPELGQHFKNDRNITSALSLPLRVGDRCVGVLNVNRINHPDMFQEHHREMLSLFAEHVGAVIDRAQAMERMGSRSRQLEQDVQKLTEMNHMKDLFLSTASHELKTPLTSVIAYAELLDDNETQLSPEQRSEFHRRLRGEAERLLGLIEDILDLTRLESGKLTLKPVRMSLNEVAKAAVETSRSMAQKHGVKIEEKYLADLPQVPIDEVKLRQVIVNLVVNAIKFSPQKSKVTVSTTREPKFLLLEVSDEGKGIHPDEATHIFELFGQGVPGKEQQRDVGVGIGLHLVKRITELHGGHVGVNSVVGKGSTFWVRLPLALATEEPAPPLRAAA